MTSPKTTLQFYKLAICFEGSLIPIACILGFLMDVDPFAYVELSDQALSHGLIGTIPLLLLFSALYQMDIKAVNDIREITLKTMGAPLSGLHWADLLVLAALAGIAEETLFRGVLQIGMQSAWGDFYGLIASNVLFGVAHAISALYFFLAMMVGVYLGLAMDYNNQRNLLTPIVIHGAYDFVAFLWIARCYRKQNQN